MPDKRQHRGPHPEDEANFAAGVVPRLREAVGDLSWLLTRGYADRSALKLVGDHFQFTRRQRLAVMRCACSDASLASRGEREVDLGSADVTALWIDGYNLLTSVEAALAGGFLIRGRDGCLRDMASMHGSYRKVQETLPALRLIGRTLAEWDVEQAVWYLDRPVSNSGRLKTAMAELAEAERWRWDIRIVPSPDYELAQCDGVVVTADSVILDRCGGWVNLSSVVVGRHIPQARVVDLGNPGE